MGSSSAVGAGIDQPYDTAPVHSFSSLHCESTDALRESDANEMPPEGESPAKTMKCEHNLPEHCFYPELRHKHVSASVDVRPA